MNMAVARSEYLSGTSRKMQLFATLLALIVNISDRGVHQNDERTCPLILTPFMIFSDMAVSHQADEKVVASVAIT